jgi:hypothetical protein
MAKGDRWALGELVPEWAECGYFRLGRRHSCIGGHGGESLYFLLWGEPGFHRFWGLVFGFGFLGLVFLGFGFSWVVFLG